MRRLSVHLGSIDASEVGDLECSLIGERESGGFGVVQACGIRSCDHIYHFEMGETCSRNKKHAP